jgi:hypothetical protein
MTSSSRRPFPEYGNHSLSVTSPAPHHNGEWKQRTTSNNSVPLSTASTAAPTPRAPATNSPPPGFCDPTAALLATPVGTFVNDCPPSPMLTKRLLAIAQTRKRAGRHSLVSTIKVDGNSKRVLRLTVPSDSTTTKNPVDRWGIRDDLYSSLLNEAGVIKKQSGKHHIQKRRIGLSGEVEQVLVMQTFSSSSSSSLFKSGRSSSFKSCPTTIESVFSPDPSLF